MSDFFVIIFGGDQYYQYKINELLANSFNGIVSEEYAFQGIRYCFPIIAEEDQYYIEDKNANWDFTINGEILTEKRALKSGDYIRVSGQNASLAMLVLEYAECSFSSEIYKLNRADKYYIGRSDEMNIVVNTSVSVSRKHAAIRVDESGTAYVDDVSGKTGVYVNGRKTTNYELKNGDHIFVMGVSMVYYDLILVIPSNIKVRGMEVADGIISLTPKDNFDEGLYVRTPRIQKTLDTETIEIDYPTPVQKQKEMPFILVAGPSITMIFAMLACFAIAVSRVMSSETKEYVSIIPSAVMAISMLLGALFWPILLRRYNKRVTEANEEFRQTKYRTYLREKENKIAAAYDRNIRIWNDVLYPECRELINNVVSQNRHLWERTNKDTDFLEVRLGTGQKAFEVNVDIKKRGFELEDDSLRNEAYGLAEKYREMKNVPITLSLIEHKVVGVVGDYALIAKNIITNLVSLYSPDEVKIVLIYNRYQEREFGRFNDLPHMWSSDKTSRYVATTEGEVYTLFNEIDEKIQSREVILGADELRVPHFVVLSFDQTLTETVSFKKTLVNSENTLGVSSVFFGERFNQIPKECEAIIQRNDETCGVYVKNENYNRFILFAPDELSDTDISNLVKGLSQIRIKKEKASSDVPERISFLDMYQVGNVEALNISSHWNANTSNKTLAAPVGVMAGGEIFYLDIHEKYHGCHGLVAGTTGSGKSEFLQAYILSMMINYSPNEVAFVLVDFKGGDMARPFLNSPHLAATISNLSGNTLYRALVSLEAEVKNRQRVFNEAASKLGIDKIDINSYHRYYKERRLTQALPHLVIVIDEFAQLKMQHPEFMAKLIDVAQVGRSLGIHLILATQKPNGVVDPQIWSNSRFRVCLKVIDKQDSSDMINKSVAAMIKTPGRAYVQVGYDEIFELIQSGYSGADYMPQNTYVNEDSVTVSMVNWPGEEIRKAKDTSSAERTDLTQLEAVMREIASLGERLHLKTKKLWLDPLPERLLLESLTPSEEMFGTVTCGILDLPHLQKQVNYDINFIRDGHLAVYGTSGTGKSTFIQSIFFAMAQKYDPSRFVSFILDFNGGSLTGLSKMPQCIEYTTDQSEDKVTRILKRIEQIISDRRAEFMKANCANYESYLEAGHNDMPIILVVIDNYASFRERMYKSEDKVVQNISSASACGIYFIVTGNTKGAIYYKIMDHIRNRVIFNMTDSGSYRDILNVHIPVFPENIKGRAIVAYEKTVAEVQIAVPYDAESEANRVQRINNYYALLKEQYGKNCSYTLTEEKPADFYQEEEEIESIYKRKEMKKYLGSGETDVIVIGEDITTGQVIDFSLNSQKKIFVANRYDDRKIVSNMCRKVAEKGRTVRVFSSRFNQMNLPENMFVQDIDEYIGEYEKNGDVLIIDGFSDFYDVISDATLERLEGILRASDEKNIITFDDMSRIENYNSTELYLILVKCDFGVLMGGSAGNKIAFLLSDGLYSIPEDYRSVNLEPSQAIVYYNDSASYIQVGGHDE